LDFAPDGKTLATSCDDTSVLIWDINRPLSGKPPLPAPRDAAEAERLYTSLGDPDAAAMEPALWALVRAPHLALPILKERLQPVRLPKRLQGLIEQLNSPKYRERETATRELTALAELAVPALRAALAKNMVPLEQRRRIERVLDKLEDPGAIPSCLRELRGIEVLERVGSGEARRVLERIATGEPDALLTREARALPRRRRAGTARESRPTQQPPARLQLRECTPRAAGGCGARRRPSQSTGERTGPRRTAMLSVVLATSLGVALHQGGTADGKSGHVRAAAEEHAVAEAKQYGAQFRLAQHEWERGRFGAALAALGKTDPGQRGWEHAFLKRLCEKGVRKGGEHALLQEHTSYVSTLAFSPDGRRIVSSADGRVDENKKWIPCQVKVWDIAAGRETLTIPQTCWFVHVAVSPGGKRLAVGGDDGTMAVWDAATGKRLWRVEPFDRGASAPRIWGTLYCPDGKRLICREQMGRVAMLDAEGKTVRRMGEQDGIGFLALSPDGILLVAGGHTRNLVAWDVPAGRERKLFKKGRNELPVDHHFPHPFLNCAAFSKNGKWLATGSGRGPGYYVRVGKGHAKLGPGRGTVHLWETKTGENVLVIEDLPLPIDSLSFSPDGRRLVGADGKTVRFWDVRTGVEVFQISADTYRVCFSPDGRRLACAEHVGVKVWDAGVTGKRRQ
jgi:WD40 repeat protein